MWDGKLLYVFMEEGIGKKAKFCLSKKLVMLKFEKKKCWNSIQWSKRERDEIYLWYLVA